MTGRRLRRRGLPHYDGQNLRRDYGSLLEMAGKDNFIDQTFPTRSSRCL
jgi:hypothetical protein